MTRAERGADVTMDALTGAIAWTRSDRYKRWEDMYRKGISSMDRPVGLSAERARVLAETMTSAFRTNLVRSESFYISDDAQTLLDVARASLPPARLDESDILVPVGFAWLASPYQAFHEGRRDLYGFAWSIGSFGDQTRVVNLAALMVEDGIVGPYQVLPLTLGEVPQEAHGSDLCRLAISFWLLAQQRVMSLNKETVGRPTRRRAKVQKIKTTIIVTLRRREYPETDGSRKVDWTHRWLTRGHWRNQWYPSEGRHRPIWIADHVKGPTDKPFVAKRRAFEFNR